MASIKSSNGAKAGDSPKLLWEVLQYLGHEERPLYRGFKEKLNDRVEWRVEVYIYTKKSNPLIIEASVRSSTFNAGIRNAACQAIFRIREMYAHELSNTRYRYFPSRRICNPKKKICGYNNKHLQQHGPDELIQEQIKITGVLVATSDDTSDELTEARCKIRELELELEALRGRKATVVAAPPPHPQLVANGNSIHDDEGVSFGGSSAITQAQAQGDRLPSTQKSFVMHPAMEVEAPRQNRASASSPYYEGQVRGKNLVAIISDGGVGLGKEPANASNPAHC